MGKFSHSNIDEINREAAIILELLSQASDNNVDFKVCEDTFELGNVSPMGNVGCVYSCDYFNRLICLCEGNEGDYCQYWKNCRYFTKRSVNYGR